MGLDYRRQAFWLLSDGIGNRPIQAAIMRNTRKILYSRGAQSLLKLLTRSDILTRNGGKSIVGLHKRAIEPLIVRWNDSLIAGLITFSRDCAGLIRSSGIKYLVIYLKASQVILQQSLGGYKIKSTIPLKCLVSRTKAGLPRIIPRSHRVKIRMGSRSYIRIGMTLLGFYRVLEFPGSLSIKTIITPGKALPGDLIIEFRDFIFNVFWKELAGMKGSHLIQQANSRNRKGNIDLGTPFVRLLTPKPYVIRKSSPTTEKTMMGDTERDISTSPQALAKAAAAGVHGRGKEKVFGPYSLRDLLTGGLKNSNSGGLFDMIVGLSDDYMKQHKKAPTSYLGKLGTKEEPAGKVRVFAMVDAFTQWIFSPLHKQLFKVLGAIKQDGTFNQHKPVKALLSRKTTTGLWSYDLSAATDRLPIKIQEILLMPVLGLHGTDAGSALLVRREYSIRGVPGVKSVKYAVGQPMGALSSWAMLALTHHAIVQGAGYRICTRLEIKYRWFTEYAVLGDDIIIANSAVATEYIIIMDQLGVEIGLAKSLVSPNKLVGEFAKKFYIPSDASMIPYKESIAAGFNGNEFTHFVNKYKLSVAQSLRVAGFGHKALAVNKLFKKSPKRLRNTLLLLSAPMCHLGFVGSQFFHLKGGKMLASLNTRSMLQSLKDHSISAVSRQLKSCENIKAGAWELKMLPRNIKLGLPFEPFIPGIDGTAEGTRLLSLISSEMDDVSYQFSEIEKKVKEIPTMPLNWESFEQGLAVRQDLATLSTFKSLTRARLRDEESHSVRVSQVKSVSTYGKVVGSPTDRKSSKVAGK